MGLGRPRCGSSEKLRKSIRRIASRTSVETHLASCRTRNSVNRLRLSKLPDAFFANYSFYDRFNMTTDSGEQGADLRLLLKDIRFSSTILQGLEFVDILR